MDILMWRPHHLLLHHGVLCYVIFYMCCVMLYLYPLPHVMITLYTGMVWFEMVLYGVVWCGVVWYGVIWYDRVPPISVLSEEKK